VVPTSTGKCRAESSSDSSKSNKKKKRKSKPKGDKAKKKRDRSSSSDTSSSSSDRSSHSVSSETAAKRKRKKKKTSSQRKREPPFKPGEEEMNIIFMQLVTNIPFAHPRKSVNQAWKFHFRALHDKGVALDCTKQKTFTAWATRMCQERCAWRLAESRQNGKGELAKYTALDEVMRKWEQAKLSGTNTKNPLAAELMRSACTSTASSLDARTAQIQAAMSKRYGGSATKDAEEEQAGSTSPSGRQQASTPTSASALLSPPVSSSGRTSATTEARLAFNEAMSSLTRSTESENQILQQLLVAISGKQPGTSNDQPSPGDVPVPLRAALENAGPNYNSLVPYASTIHTALGISTLDEFKLITEEDIMQVPLPAMQKRALFSLARAQGLGSQAL
jgi:hypothetical protein